MLNGCYATPKLPVEGYGGLATHNTIRCLPSDHCFTFRKHISWSKLDANFPPSLTDVTSTVLPAVTAKTVDAAEGDHVFESANSLPSRSEAAAVQPVVGISQRVKMRSNEKKDLGTLGMMRFLKVS